MLANVLMDEAEAVISLGTKIHRLQRGLLILLDLIHRESERDCLKSPNRAQIEALGVGKSGQSTIP
jgi:hypothetical protein